MIKQISFIVIVLITCVVFFISIYKYYRRFMLLKPFRFRNFGKRFIVMLDIAFVQTRILRKPVIGFLHSIVFWGFCVIIFGSIEMIIDGLFGTERVLTFLGPVYNVLMAGGDLFAALITFAIIVFLIRRLFHGVKRLNGPEMLKKSHLDANIALTLILLLMISLLGMNIFYICSTDGTISGTYPVSSPIAVLIGKGEEYHFLYEIFWWTHIVLIFIFTNILPYSKHFHVFMSIPNVFFSRLEPLGKLPTMVKITEEVKRMMDPSLAYTDVSENTGAIHERFGVRDAEDVNWKNYMDALSCTECGRCSSVCPANSTGKKLSPRKIFMDLRARMKEKAPGMIKAGREYSDNKSLIRDFITEEEVWACTTCNACARECPVSINHPTLILDMRRYLVMEEGLAPSGIKSMMTNIENNGAPWQYSPEDRMLWAQ